MGGPGVAFRYYDHAPSNKSNEGFVLEIVSPTAWASNIMPWVRNFQNSIKKDEFDSVLLLEEIGGKRSRWVGTFSKTALLSSVRGQLISYAPKKLDRIRLFQNGKEVNETVKHVEELEKWTNEVVSSQTTSDGISIEETLKRPPDNDIFVCNTLRGLLMKYSGMLSLYVIGFFFDDSLKSENNSNNLQRAGTSPKLRTQQSINMTSLQPQFSFNSGMSFDRAINLSKTITEQTKQLQGGVLSQSHMSLDYQSKVIGDLTVSLIR